MGARSCGSNTLLAYHFRVLAPALCLALRHPPLLFLTHSCCAVALLHSGRSGGQASEKDFECSPRVRLSSRRVTADRPSGSVQLVVPASPALPRRSRHGLPGMACPCAPARVLAMRSSHARTYGRVPDHPPAPTHAPSLSSPSVSACPPRETGSDRAAEAERLEARAGRVACGRR